MICHRKTTPRTDKNKKCLLEKSFLITFVNRVLRNMPLICFSSHSRNVSIFLDTWDVIVFENELRPFRLVIPNIWSWAVEAKDPSKTSHCKPDNEYLTNTRASYVLLIICWDYNATAVVLFLSNKEQDVQHTSTCLSDSAAGSFWYEPLNGE